MIMPFCARCGIRLEPHALVVEVREVTRVDEESASHDRADLLAHVQCPRVGDWDRIHNRPADIYTPPEDRVPRPL